MEAAILSKCLELTRKLKSLNISFDINLKLENSVINFTSSDNKDKEKGSMKKSPSQIKRDQQRKEKHLLNKEKRKLDSVKDNDKVDSVKEDSVKKTKLVKQKETNEEFLGKLINTKTAAAKT